MRRLMLTCTVGLQSEIVEWDRISIYHPHMPRPRNPIRAWADSKYHNHGLNEWIATESPGKWRLEVVRRPEGSTGFVLLPKRWVVERTLAWLGRCRRNSKDYERRTDSSESMIRISAIHLMLKRLQPSNVYRPFRYRDAA